MTKILKSETPSVLLRQQINNISARMRSIVTKTILHPLHNMADFNKARAHFTKIEDAAYSSCLEMDKSQSIGTEDNAIKATYALIHKLTDLKNEARQLVENESRSGNLLARFHKQLDLVEQLMNESISPLIEEGSVLSEEGRRQALETLERWSELYRHGLKATGNISERGEEWLIEAYQRLDLTADALRQLDIKNEATATRGRKDKKSKTEDAVS